MRFTDLYVWVMELDGFDDDPSGFFLATVLDVSLSAGCELLYPARSMKLGGVRPKLVWRHDEAFLQLARSELEKVRTAAQSELQQKETAIGAHPVLAIEIMAAVARTTEREAPYEHWNEWRVRRDERDPAQGTGSPANPIARGMTSLSMKTPVKTVFPCQGTSFGMPTFTEMSVPTG